MKLRIIAVVVLVILLTSLLAGCDASIEVSGAVYEWINAPEGAEGQIYFDQLPPQSDNELRPIESAVVHLFTNERRMAEPDINREYRKSGAAWTDSNGKFDYVGIVGGGKYHVKILVDQKSFYPVEYIFPFDSLDFEKIYEFTVVLVRIQ